MHVCFQKQQRGLHDWCAFVSHVQETIIYLGKLHTHHFPNSTPVVNQHIMNLLSSSLIVIISEDTTHYALNSTCSSYIKK